LLIHKQLHKVKVELFALGERLEPQSDLGLALLVRCVLGCEHVGEPDVVTRECLLQVVHHTVKNLFDEREVQIQL
jgi:hypothetical protein